MLQGGFHFYTNELQKYHSPFLCLWLTSGREHFCVVLSNPQILDQAAAIKPLAYYAENPESLITLATGEKEVGKEKDTG